MCFDVYNAYGKNGKPSDAVVSVLMVNTDAFAFDGKPGEANNVKMKIVVNQCRLHGEHPR